MKKIISLILFLFCFTFSFTACKSENKLLNAVSELRQDIYQGQGKSLSLTAGYGFKEQPFTNDGKVGQTINFLTFKLVDKETDTTTYSLNFNFKGVEYIGTFKLNPVTNTVICAIEVNDFDLKEFTVQVSYGSTIESISLKSIVPNNAITYSSALNFFLESQNSLISHYTDTNGNFNAEIYLRIIVKDGAPYWYLGVANGNDRLKALLIDGINGEILAIREIF